MPVDQLLRVDRGRKTPALKEVPQVEADDSVLFCLVFDEKTVAFQARTPEETSNFVEAFEV